ncbi:uncharacterized protein LOC129579538, partial [Sitodiplosis mosellana]|uniref:uncharacterized protein LOC129579538 n=1 Tax=Sitodiplosis mosellana TaxID=263140 RepID=UPI002444269A
IATQQQDTASSQLPWDKPDKRVQVESDRAPNIKMVMAEAEKSKTSASELQQNADSRHGDPGLVTIENQQDGGHSLTTTHESATPTTGTFNSEGSSFASMAPQQPTISFSQANSKEPMSASKQSGVGVDQNTPPQAMNGASNEQQQIRRTFQDESNDCQQIHGTWRNLSMQNSTTTQWKFIPPSAPHMGGLHEAAVKSAKAHLKRVIGAQQLTFEQLATLLTQVEACLNSRPLLALSDDATDELALTPGHFLVGEPLVAPLSRDHTSTSANRLKNFELMGKMAQEFWSRWSSEYVTTLME